MAGNVYSHEVERVGAPRRYKCPRAIDVVETLSRNSSGKILKRSLRAPYWHGRERQI